jgi:SAM-dependent methyltransferase
MALTARYESPDAWATWADPAYEALGRAIVARAAAPLESRLVVDLGAGTGATSRAIAAAGGHPLAVDLSHAMVAHQRHHRPPAIVADIARLPLTDGAVGATVAAFSLSHVEEPVAVLTEMARVTAAGGSVLVGVFAAAGARHEAAAAVDAAARRRGWVVPDWYVHLKSDLEPRSSAVDMLLTGAARAGLLDASVVDVEVDAGLDTAGALVDWRLAGPAMAPFVAGLGRADAVALRAEAIAALGQDVAPLRPAVRILSSVAPAAR